MNPMRREVLKSIAAAGVALPAAATVHAGVHRLTGSAGEGLRVLPVTSGQPLDAAFVRGVAAAARGTATLLPAQAIAAFAPAALAAVGNATEGRPTAIVGLTDSATALLVLDRVRSAGGSVLATAHHRLAAEADAAAWAAGLGELAVAQAHSRPALPALVDDGATGAAYVAGGISYMSFTCIV